MAKAKVEKETTVDAGSGLGKVLQEKQINLLEKTIQALTSAVDGYTTNIEKLNSELTDLYYKIQEKEVELAKMEENATKDRKEKVLNLENQINDLAKVYDVKQREHDVEFQLKLKASKDKVMYELMSSNGLAKISSDDLKALHKEVADLKDVLTKGFDAEVTKVEKALQKDYDSQIDVLKLTHEKNESTNKATIEQLRSKVEFLQEQLDKGETRINNILENQVKIAQADKGIIINTTDKK